MGHLLLEQRKILCAKTLFIESILDLEKTVTLTDQDITDLDTLVPAVFGLTKKPRLELSDNDENLDTFLRVLYPPIIQQIQLLLSSSALQHQLIANLQARLKLLSCASCSGAFSKPCNSRDEDDEIVEKGGACIAPFKNMFRVAENALISYYKHFPSPSSHHTNLASVNFSTENSVRPHTLPVAFHVGGKTKFEDNTASRHSEIKLTVNVDRFDIETYTAILYVLFHECISHAYYGIFPPHSKRQSTAMEDSFSEGWMDWLSFKIMDDILTGQCRLSCSGSNLLQPIRMRLAGAAFYNAKLNSHIKLLTGRRVAEKILNLFSRRPDSCSDPWVSFLKLSFDLNLQNNFSKDMKTLFIARCERLVDQEIPGIGNPPGHSIVAGIFSGYLKHGNVKILIQELTDVDLFSFDK
jgi:hypothetical protein